MKILKIEPGRSTCWDGSIQVARKTVIQYLFQQVIMVQRKIFFPNFMAIVFILDGCEENRKMWEKAVNIYHIVTAAEIW